MTVFGQWSAANSGTTNNLNGAYLLDSGVGFVVGDAGRIVKTTDAGMMWSPLTSGTTNALYDVYFFDATQGVTVGEQGLILRTTDGGTAWGPVSSDVGDTLRSVSFSGVNGICGGDSQRKSGAHRLQRNCGEHLGYASCKRFSFVGALRAYRRGCLYRGKFFCAPR